MRSNNAAKPFVIALALFVNLWTAAPAQASAHAPLNIPALESFIASVQDGQASVLRGVYVADRLAFRVEQQPRGNNNFVSAVANVATQYRLASYYGVIGLLAHNTSSGRTFSSLTIGDEVNLIYGDGRVKRYRVAALYRYRLLNPASLKSDLIDLRTGQVHSAADVFAQVYIGDDQVTLQTCIQKGGQAAWGRLFVVATPLASDTLDQTTLRLLNQPR